MRAVAVLASLLILAPLVLAASPDPGSHWFTRINTTHAAPQAMSVVIVPQGYFSQSTMVDQTGWIGANALMDEPGTRAALEATRYWQWMIDNSEGTYPALAHLSYTTKVLGVDATLADVQTADILVNTAMVADPLPFIFHLGLGLPTLPASHLTRLVFTSSLINEEGQTVCTVWNTGVGQDSADDPTFDVIGDVGDAMRENGSPVWFNRIVPNDDESPTRLRNLIVHEFGHCLGAGHMGESLGFAHSNGEGVVYEDHPTDVLSVAFGHYRQCLSNANMLSLAEGYAWTLSGTTWQPHDAEAYLLKSQYAQTCIPNGLKTY